MSDAYRLQVDPVACDGHGACAELLPELVDLDEWGYPILAGHEVPAALLRRARQAAAACPVLALRLSHRTVGAMSTSGEDGAVNLVAQPTRSASARLPG